jgi:excinuclease ABC subunit C
MIKEKLKSVPQKPGVYLLKNSKGQILYTGKAKSLRDRLRSHFNAGKREDLKHRLMMDKVTDFETIVTDSEVEALIMEANFVKEHRPRYNVNLKDDKTYPYIRITDEPYPRVFITRRIVRDGSKYFGPYTDVGTMRQLMSGIRRIFPIRTCKFYIDYQSIQKKKHKLCLMYHIGKCQGPCEGLIDRDEYYHTVKQVVAFIRGKNSHLIRDLDKMMADYAKQQRYEEAARLRDQIRLVSTFGSKQKVVDQFTKDKDIITVASEGKDSCGVVFNIRDGKVVNRLHFYLEGTENKSDIEILTSFIKQYYVRTDMVPPEVYLSIELDDIQQFRDWLSDKRGAKVIITVPQKGKKARLMDMCARNARLLLDELKLHKKQISEQIEPSILALQKDLRLENAPKRIEAFDVSNLQGCDAVASMVVFDNGKPKKGEYRKFKIKNVQGIDDFRMMAETVERRITRILKENRELPDLILVDGGKGQLSAVLNVLKKFEISDQPVIGLAKRLEEIYLPGISDPQTLPRSSISLRLLQRIRDEAHRFAVTYHRTLRKKRTMTSALDSIPGIGEKRRTALIRQFGSINNIQNATVNEIASVEGMNLKIAGRIKEILNKK